MDVEQFDAKNAANLKAAQNQRDQISARGRIRDEYIKAWRLLQNGLEQWASDGNSDQLRSCVLQFSSACEKHLGDDWLTNVQDFSPAVFDDDPNCRIQANCVAVILGILAACQSGSDVDLPSHTHDICQYLVHHAGYVRDLVDAGKTEAFCSRCDCPLWVDQFKEGNCGCDAPAGDLPSVNGVPEVVRREQTRNSGDSLAVGVTLRQIADAVFVDSGDQDEAKVMSGRWSKIRLKTAPVGKASGAGNPNLFPFPAILCEIRDLSEIAPSQFDRVKPKLQRALQTAKQ